MCTVNCTREKNVYKKGRLCVLKNCYLPIHFCFLDSVEYTVNKKQLQRHLYLASYLIFFLSLQEFSYLFCLSWYRFSYLLLFVMIGIFLPSLICHDRDFPTFSCLSQLGFSYLLLFLKIGIFLPSLVCHDRNFPTFSCLSWKGYSYLSSVWPSPSRDFHTCFLPSYWTQIQNLKSPGSAPVFLPYSLY